MQNDSDRSQPAPPPPPPSSDTIAGHLQLLRSILSTDQHVSPHQRAALQAIDREAADRRLLMQEDNTITPSIIRTLPRDGYWSTRAGSAARERRQAIPQPASRLSPRQSRMSRLTRPDIPENTSPAMPRPPPIIHTSRVRQASADLDVESRPLREGRYSKRRKLDDGSSDDHDRIPEYPAKEVSTNFNLKMRFLDPGHGQWNDAVHIDDHAKMNLHNIVNKDIFRPATKFHSILMKHQGGWPFDLAKLVVKLPSREYEAPPLQGMVFIAMNSEQLLADTLTYDSLLPTYHSWLSPSWYDSYRPLRDYPPPPRSIYQSPYYIRPVTDLSNVRWHDNDSGERHMSHICQVAGFDVTVKHELESKEDSHSPRSSPEPWRDDHRAFTRRRYFNNRIGARFAERRTVARANDDYVTAGESSSSASDNSDDDEQGAPLAREMALRERELQRELDEVENSQESLAFYKIAHATNRSTRLREQRRGEYIARDPQNNPQEAHVAGMPNLESHPPSIGLDTSDRGYYPSRLSTKRLPGPAEMLHGKSPTARHRDKACLPHAKFQVSQDEGAVSINFDPPV